MWHLQTVLDHLKQLTKCLLRLLALRRGRRRRSQWLHERGALRMRPGLFLQELVKTGGQRVVLEGVPVVNHLQKRNSEGGGVQGWGECLRKRAEDKTSRNCNNRRGEEGRGGEMGGRPIHLIDITRSYGVSPAVRPSAYAPWPPPKGAHGRRGS